MSPAASSSLERVRVESFVVHRERHDVGSQAREDLQRAVVGRRLDEHAAGPRPEQLLRVEDESLEPSRRQQDPARIDAVAGAERLAQRPVAAAGPVGEHRRVGLDRGRARSRRAGRRRGTPARARHGQTRSCGSTLSTSCAAATLFLTDGVVSSCEVCSSSDFPCDGTGGRGRRISSEHEGVETEYAVFPRAGCVSARRRSACRARHPRSLPDPGARAPGCPRRPRHPREVADGLRQDARLRRAARRAARRERRSARPGSCWYPRASSQPR